MCMLFAVSAKDSFEANEYLKSFFEKSSEHPHGWGLAYLRSGKTVIKKECVKASESETLAALLKKPLRSKLIMAHIRYATIGNVDTANCHPFSGLDKDHLRLTLMHNGTIFDCPVLSRYIRRQKGETDSERIFLHLKESREKLGSTGFDERFELYQGIISDMAKGNKLNLIFTDGEYLFVHTNCRETLFYLEKDGATVFATAPLDGDKWRRVPFCALLAYKDGELVRQGEAHGNEYIENNENMKLLYRIFSNL